MFKKHAIQTMHLFFLLIPFLGFDARAETMLAHVNYVYDGDTFLIETVQPCLYGETCPVKRLNFKIRLAGIDAPEHDQPYGLDAKYALMDLIQDQDIKLFVETKDKYGRLVATAKIGSTSVTHEMVRHGLAWVYPYFNDDSALYPIQKEAKAQQYGLWSQPKIQNIAPWKWRKKQQNKNTQVKY